MHLIMTNRDRYILEEYCKRSVNIACGMAAINDIPWNGTDKVVAYIKKGFGKNHLMYVILQNVSDDVIVQLHNIIREPYPDNTYKMMFCNGNSESFNVLCTSRPPTGLTNLIKTVWFEWDNPSREYITKEYMVSLL